MNGSVRVAAMDTDGANFVDDLNAGDVSTAYSKPLNLVIDINLRS